MEKLESDLTSNPDDHLLRSASVLAHDACSDNIENIEEHSLEFNQSINISPQNLHRYFGLFGQHCEDLLLRCHFQGRDKFNVQNGTFDF